MSHLNHTIAALAALAINAAALAQSPINAPGEMQPSAGTGIYHAMFMYRETGSDPFRGERGSQEYVQLSQIAYGITYDLSVQFDIPVGYRDVDAAAGSSAEDELGVGEIEMLFKQRLWQHNPGPTDTIRWGLLGGVQMPGDIHLMEMDNSIDAWNPILGTVFSAVLGRHGFNTSVMYEWYTGGDGPEYSDTFHYDASYLFRIDPAQYTAETTGAWYAMAELNAHYDLNGDHEIYISPGIMYEARKFTFDATLMIPVYQDVQWRGESEFVVGLGLRISF
jgi:hypothetical protein